MRIIAQVNSPSAAGTSRRPFRSWRIRRKLLVGLIPPIITLLIATGYVTYRFSNQFLMQAVEHTVLARTLAFSHEIEDFFDHCRQDILLLARQSPSPEQLEHLRQSFLHARGYEYGRFLFLDRDSKPLFHLQPGEVWLSGIQSTGGGSGLDPYEEDARSMIHLTTPRIDPHGRQMQGYAVMSIAWEVVRDCLAILTVRFFNRSGSTPADDILFFDLNGRVLYQFKTTEGQFETALPKTNQPIEQAIPSVPTWSPVAGRLDFAKPECRDALAAVKKGKYGIISLTDSKTVNARSEPYRMGYAPVWFRPGGRQPPVLLGGIAFADRSRLTQWAGYRQIDAIFIISLATICIISAFIFALGHSITRPILALASAVEKIDRQAAPKTIQLADRDQETSLLKAAINNLITTLTSQMEEIRIKDELLYTESQKEKAQLEQEVQTLRQQLLNKDVDEIIGVGPVIESLKADIIKAAAVDADVLIMGETGTGKQLTAEAIHRHSRRSQHPFVSINCGALDENLLLDSLFGHVKGAFTQARCDRKGAFLAAHRGTLFLDEIGTASPRVQQALLRAISMREIRPLGSDTEISVDVRLVAASNEDLRKMVAQGRFREDLYYRLAVIVIQTPALRHHMENIPLLVDHFLTLACQSMERPIPGVSKAALDKIKRHHWPGNMRELKNCMMRAVAMAEGELIQDKDISLGTGDSAVQHPGLSVSLAGEFPGEPAWEQPDPPRADPSAGLSPRQQLAWPLIARQGVVSRAEYQRAVGGRLPARTALYDLQDLVQRGWLRKTGRGPATRYILARQEKVN